MRKAATKKTARGADVARERKLTAKTTGNRAAGKVASAPRVTAKTMAADIVRRDNRRPGFYDSLQAEVQALRRKESPTASATQAATATH